MCLLIGPTGAGKTLLLKILQTGNYNSPKALAQMDIPATIPTTGTNLVNVVVHKKKEVTVRELGGSMGPIWKNYYRDSSAIIYVVDVSNRCQVASACIQLLTVLTHAQTTDTPVLLLLNKQDLPCVMSRNEIEWLFRLDEVCQHTTQKITVLDVSAKTGQGLDQVARWIYDSYKEPASQC
ncbi:ADP-ribosylation factor-like protein 16 [Babylonia areolata]|uniref:ADP-ribosylation factor-like protein 16 n=1 Tax=Babylonia areolata TaxID=304850 RepID=UPI003FCFBE8B